MSDDSALPTIRRGEYALCRRPWTVDERPLHDDLSAIERWMNGVVELTIRRAVVDNEGRGFFRFESTDARYAEHLEIDPGKTPTDYKVIGTVLYAVRSVANTQSRLGSGDGNQGDPFR
jgi:hypothetical protein